MRKQGEPEAAEHDINVAERAPVILPKSLIDATVLAKIITGKFVDGLSFYREHKVLQREGIDIGYSTLCHYPCQQQHKSDPLGGKNGKIKLTHLRFNLLS